MDQERVRKLLVPNLVKVSRACPWQIHPSARKFITSARKFTTSARKFTDRHCGFGLQVGLNSLRFKSFCMERGHKLQVCVTHVSRAGQGEATRALHKRHALGIGG